MDKKNIDIIGQKKTRKSIDIISILAISFFLGIVLATNASAIMSNWKMDINVNSTDAAGNLLESKINFGVDMIATDGYDGAPFDIDAAPISGIDGTLGDNAVGTITPKNTITGFDGISSFIYNATSTGTRIFELLNDLIFGTVAIIVLEPK